MSICCVQNCKSRTDRSNKKNYNYVLYYFPKEHKLRKQWFEGCQRKEGDIKLNYDGRIGWRLRPLLRDALGNGRIVRRLRPQRI
ncbi:hypothetical protein P5V15_001246 [Pogonomyrmex californicus]